MRQYYDPQKISEVGKRVERIGNKQPRIPAGHYLIAKLNNLLRDVCPDVTNLNEFQVFYDAYYAGYWVSMELYIVPETTLKDCQQ